MENEENKGFGVGGRGANPSAARHYQGAAGRGLAALSALFSGRYYELLEEWFRTGHGWMPSAEELLLFLEGEL